MQLFAWRPLSNMEAASSSAIELDGLLLGMQSKSKRIKKLQKCPSASTGRDSAHVGHTCSPLSSLPSPLANASGNHSGR